ncbi:MAG: hypothetical protein Q7U74_02590, partial [Saprospiraceae bacterium]|nr:hypothetical protein [Saprospiraceae bacterium]
SRRSAGVEIGCAFVGDKLPKKIARKNERVMVGRKGRLVYIRMLKNFAEGTAGINTMILVI